MSVANEVKTRNLGLALSGSAVTIVSPLDLLLSPPPKTALSFPRFDDQPPVRDSQSSFNDVSLDDVALTAVPVTARPARRGGTEKVEEYRRRSVDSIKSVDLRESRSDRQNRPVSTSSVRSASNLPFILARLDLQKSQDESCPNPQRASVDGQLKLQEEFARLQNEKQEEEERTSSEAIDWDFWGAVISDYQGFASAHAEKLARAIERGIPDTLRGMMWQLMAVSKDPALESTYLKLLKETSPHEKAITRDLGRTLPHHHFFTDGQGVGQENLFNVLKAYSLYDPTVGYCQGLPFVVAILLLNMPDEEAFTLLVRLMYSYDLRGHYLPEMPKLQQRLFQFDRLLEELVPAINMHFLRQGVKSSMFCSQWFLTLFSYRFPLSIVFRIYENCLASGIEAIFGFSLALLRKNEDALLAMKMDQILTFLHTRVFEAYRIEPIEEGSEAKYDVDAFIQDAIELRITPFMLDTFAHEYEALVRARDALDNEMNSLRNTNRSLSAQVKNVEENLAQVNAEHVEVLNELVKSRLRNEELEEELVRYKLLYAEAMHENEDAHSSTRLSVSSMLSSHRGSG